MQLKSAIEWAQRFLAAAGMGLLGFVSQAATMPPTEVDRNLSD
jgi:predicted MFS family arabinose efflux permease